MGASIIGRLSTTVPVLALKTVIKPNKTEETDPNTIRRLLLEALYMVQHQSKNKFSLPLEVAHGFSTTPQVYLQ